MFTVTGVSPDTELVTLVFQIERNREATVKILRNYFQISYFHSLLEDEFPYIVLPSLPEAPSAASYEDPEYIEKKKKQIERYLLKISMRSELFNSKACDTFVSNIESVPDTHRPMQKVKQKRYAFHHMIRANYEKGFRIYIPKEEMDSDLETERAKQMTHVLKMEYCLSEILDNLTATFMDRDNLGKCSIKLSEDIASIGKPSFKLSSNETSEFNTRIGEFSTLLSQMKDMEHQQVKSEIYYFGDVLLDFSKQIENIKKLMNSRTDALAMLCLHSKQYKIQKSKRENNSTPLHPTAEASLTADFNESTRLREESRDRLLFLNEAVRVEMDLFEKEKSNFLNNALDAYCKIQLGSAEKELDLINETLLKIN